MRLFAITAALLMMFIAGCNAADNGRNASPSTDDSSPIRVRQTDPPPEPIRNPQTVSERLEQLAEQIPQVKAANCVVLGNTAIVGIDVAGQLDRSRVDTVKYSVAEALRKDPHGVHAVVTADVDMTERLGEIRNHIRNGRPAAGFAEELGEMIGRIMPQFPKETVPRQPGTNAPGNAPSEDAKQLDKSQI